MHDFWKKAPVGGEFTSSLSMEEMLDTSLSQTVELIKKSERLVKSVKEKKSAKEKKLGKFWKFTRRISDARGDRTDRRRW